jgi:hypothetical protein
VVFITLLTPGHEAYVVVASAITQETTATFMNEMDVLLDLHPNLKYDKWVLIVDGDPANFKAARIKFERVRIILCLYHATENVEKHLGHMRLTTTTESDGNIHYPIPWGTCFILDFIIHHAQNGISNPLFQ